MSGLPFLGRAMTNASFFDPAVHLVVALDIQYLNVEHVQDRA